MEVTPSFDTCSHLRGESTAEKSLAGVESSAGDAPSCSQSPVPAHWPHSANVAAFVIKEEPAGCECGGMAGQ